VTDREIGGEERTEPVGRIRVGEPDTGAGYTGTFSLRVLGTVEFTSGEAQQSRRRARK
jgi:hypothetical protein